MKKATMMLLAAAFLAGCASRQKMDDLSRQMAEINGRTEMLVRENQALRARLLNAAPRHLPAPDSQPRPRVVQPPRHLVAPTLPRQEHGYLYSPHPSCASGPYRLTIRNKSSYYIRLMVTGRPVSNYGGYGPLPHLPPGQVLYVCLDNLGANAVSGIAYAVHRGVLEEVKKFSRQIRAGLRARGHKLTIDDRDIARW